LPDAVEASEDKTVNGPFFSGWIQLLGNTVGLELGHERNAARRNAFGKRSRLRKRQEM
jgi:hypothetical protein